MYAACIIFVRVRANMWVGFEVGVLGVGVVLWRSSVNLVFIGVGMVYSVLDVNESRGGHMYTWGSGEMGKLGHQSHANKKVLYSSLL